MTDIVDRLRELRTDLGDIGGTGEDQQTCDDAADEIERLRTERDALVDEISRLNQGVTVASVAEWASRAVVAEHERDALRTAGDRLAEVVNYESWPSAVANWRETRGDQ